MELAAAVIAQQSAEARYSRKQALVDYLGREERDQADERVDVDPMRLSVRIDDQFAEPNGHSSSTDAG